MWHILLGRDRMRRVRYFVASSLDGYIARADGSVDWLFMDQDYGMSAFFKSVDVAVMGSGTHDKMLRLAPKQPFFPGMESFVFSSKSVGTKNGVTFVRGDVGAWAGDIKSRPGNDIWLVGGGNLVRQFLAAGLVDEIGVTIHPRLLGEGVALFPAPYPEVELELLRCEQYSTGLVQVFYGVKGRPTAKP
jgi:dihydrofolate reductase